MLIQNQVVTRKRQSSQCTSRSVAQPSLTARSFEEGLKELGPEYKQHKSLSLIGWIHG